MSILKLAWRNIVSNPLNLVLSVILFALGIGLISFLLLLNTQLKDKFDRNLADIDLVIGAKGSPLQMILCSMYHVDNPTGNISVSEAKPFLNPKHPLIKNVIPLSLGDNYRGYRIVGTTENILDLYKAEISEGKIWDKTLEVTIGREVADRTGLNIGDQFMSSHGFEDDDDFAHDHANFIVTGILKGNGSVIDQLILTNTSSVWAVHDHEGENQPVEDHDDHDHEGHDHDHDHDHGDHEGHNHEHDHDHDHDHDHSSHEEPGLGNAPADLLNHEDEEITSLLIQYKNRTNFQALNLARNINENTDMQAASPAIEINRLYAMIGTGTEAIRSLAILIAIVSALSIFLSLFKSMKERKYELAVMRVMGGSPSKLFLLIITEGVILAFIGFVIGMILSHSGMEVMAKFLQSDYRYSFTGWKWLNAEWILLLVSLGLGIISALIPAIRAASTDINKTLSVPKG